MPLLNNKQELKANFPAIDANIEWSSFKGFYEDAERDVITPAIGPDMVAYLGGHLTGLDGVGLQALELVQRSAAYLTVLNWSQTSTFRITDRALYISKGNDGVVISDKKLRDFRDHCLQTGHNFLDRAIDLMERNLTAFPQYADSGTRQDQQRGFIRTAVEFSAIKNIGQSRVTFLALREVMLEAQDRIFKVAMGDYYQVFKERFLDDELSPAEKGLLLMVRRALAYMTIAGAGELPIKLTPDGIFINRFNNSIDYQQQDAAGERRIQYMLDDNREKGMRQLRELREHLIFYRSDFPDFQYTPEPEIQVNDQDSGICLF